MRNMTHARKDVAYFRLFNNISLSIHSTTIGPNDNDYIFDFPATASDRVPLNTTKPIPTCGSIFSQICSTTVFTLSKQSAKKKPITRKIQCSNGKENTIPHTTIRSTYVAMTTIAAVSLSRLTRPLHE